MFSCHAKDFLAEAIMRKALNISTSMFIIRSHANMEHIISRWTETISFITSWASLLLPWRTSQLCFAYQGLLMTTHQAFFLSKEEEKMVQLWSAASNKSTDTFKMRCFLGSEGRGKGVTPQAFLSYWLSKYILPSGPEDGINAYIFPLAIRLPRGKRLRLGLLYL